MNVLMVTSSYPKFPGDVTAPFVESIARGVAERGHAVDVVLPHHPDLRRGDEPVRFFPYRYAPREDWSVWGYAQSLHSDVRVRRTLELRAVDGLPYPAFAAVPAFWTGLTYHAPSRSRAWELVRHATLSDHLEALDDIAVRGLRATFAGQPVAELAAELLRLSEAGLLARVAAGLEDERAPGFLEPIQEVSATGDTFAERWLREDHSPERYLATHGVNAQ